jgi:hypothetical protein
LLFNGTAVWKIYNDDTPAGGKVFDVGIWYYSETDELLFVSDSEKLYSLQEDTSYGGWVQKRVKVPLKLKDPVLTKNAYSIIGHWLMIRDKVEDLKAELSFSTLGVVDFRNMDFEAKGHWSLYKDKLEIYILGDFYVFNQEQGTWNMYNIDLVEPTLTFVDGGERFLLGDWGWSRDGTLQSGYIIFHPAGKCELTDLDYKWLK